MSLNVTLVFLPSLILKVCSVHVCDYSEAGVRIGNNLI